MAVTADEVRRLFRYEPETGRFVRLVLMGRKAAVGDVAGGKSARGAWCISVHKQRHYAHRLAWLYMTGQWPSAEIDHIDGNPLNNAFSNLREATGAQNKQNRHVPRSDNAHGFMGVYRHGSRKDGRAMWRARVQLNGRQKHVGCFDTPEKANEAYLQAKRELHPFNTL